MYRKNLLNKLSQIKYLNRWVIFAIDLCISVFTTLITCWFVVYITDKSILANNYLLVLFISAGCSIVSFLYWKTYKGIIRHTTLWETWRLGAAVFTKTLFIFLILWFLFDFLNWKQMMLGTILDFLATTITLVTLRISLITIYNRLISNTAIQKELILIYGTDYKAAALANTLPQKNIQKYKIGGFISIGKQYKNYLIAGYKVYSVEDQDTFNQLINRNNIKAILFANYKSAQAEENRIVRFCEKKKVRMLIVPPLDEIKDGKIEPQKIREVSIEDLLGRDEIKINMEEISNFLEDKVVMVTGGAGSIGSELCRQLASFKIRQLILFDSAETPVHNIRLEIEEKFPKLNFTPVIGDVRSRARVDFAFRKHHPQVVFHAAAYKHVPLMEANPCEAVRVNVYGTRNVADHAVKYNVEKFVMVSTDKAVNPTNIMGASKRLAEIYVQSLSIAIGKGEIQGKTRFITTRFGNVLGSNGSVIPRFREQIQNGGPITVTHPDIIRYFMTIPEACRLVMEAATIGKGDEIFIFEMGEPVKIADMAKRMIGLAGLEPDKDIMIKYTGLRPGEKLYEELLSKKETTKATRHEKIRIASVREYDYQEVNVVINELACLSKNVEIEKTVQLMKKFVPEFISENSNYQVYDTIIKKVG